jgi:hypothetical protein
MKSGEGDRMRSGEGYRMESGEGDRMKSGEGDRMESGEGDRMERKILTQKLEGTSRRGKPRKGWKEEVERDLKVTGVRRRRELVTDRKKWSLW